MKKKIFISLMFLSILVLSGCGSSNLSDNIQSVCKYAIRDTEDYLDRKIDIKTLSKSLDELYDDYCKNLDDNNSDEHAVCLDLGLIKINASLAKNSNDNYFKKIEDVLNLLKQDCDK